MNDLEPLTFDLTDRESALSILTTPLDLLASATVTRTPGMPIPLDQQTRFEVKVRLGAARSRAAFLSSPLPLHQAMWTRPESYWLRLSAGGTNFYAEIEALFREP